MEVVRDSAGTSAQLRSELRRIDNKGYGAYKDLKGAWQFPNFSLVCEHVQSDPYAPPSQFSIIIPGKEAKYPKELLSTKLRRTALADYLTRLFSKHVAEKGININSNSSSWSGNKGGALNMSAPDQYVLERTSIFIGEDGKITARVTIELPARGRSVIGEFAETILLDTVPKLVTFLYYSSQNSGLIEKHVLCVEDQDALRDELKAHQLVAFIGNGSLLPRLSGSDNRPMRKEDQPVLFQSPPELQVELRVPNKGIIKGMGIPCGITLIVGGGFNGKTTLLEAIQSGVYNKVVGDGREYVVTDPTAVKIRAEDGRSVTKVDISTFINNLPNGKSSTTFTTEDASGSTSQAASLVEAIQIGSELILLDEDTSATNILMRDRRMQMLVGKKEEPITPIINSIDLLFTEKGVSTIMVMGGSGEYFEVADTVIKMHEYLPACVTEEAKRIAEEFPSHRTREGEPKLGMFAPRVPLPSSFRKSFQGKEKLSVKHKQLLYFGTSELQLAGVEQIAEEDQSRCILQAIMFLRNYIDGNTDLLQLINMLDSEWDSQGLDIISDRKGGNFARPRKFELAMTINRISSLEIK
eukprot:TRINITY_DN4829_c0_g1_i2.p1 TRINITY_DN4829_c0_g1~~TRINITY_DN4829_c0_g1_i2.p1  ORF type:complete len:582 (-),score=96.68 TRINITY_DN4829_c0_g1_i2:61-1806(-)